MSRAEIVQRGWEAVGAGDFDTLVADYTDDMIFIVPGQTDVLEGRQAFREALNGLGEILPPGFEITGLRQIEGESEVDGGVSRSGHVDLRDGADPDPIDTRFDEVPDLSREAHPERRGDLSAGEAEGGHRIIRGGSLDQREQAQLIGQCVDLQHLVVALTDGSHDRRHRQLGSLRADQRIGCVEIGDHVANGARHQTQCQHRHGEETRRHAASTSRIAGRRPSEKNLARRAESWRPVAIHSQAR